MLDRDQILRALARLAELLREQEVQGELCVLGGTAMVLAFHARPATRDVDAIFRPARLVREAARTVAAEQGLPEDWLNDGAKGYASARPDTSAEDLPQFEGLRVTAPTPEYMLAMKCMASRIGQSETDPSDVADIRFLLRRLALRTPAEAMEIVARYYPRGQIPPRAGFLVEELFAESEGAP